ncbi:condensation domain-containing protein [Streptomyces sp. NPDC015032]|uniref:condensation domain-containing protein n=1 Tax=Streptomyces sp. NPDC015032 TaxID=3364937 RepID=UPI0036FF33D4
MVESSSAAPSERWLATVVRRAWEHSLKAGFFADGDDFFACGGDSLTALAVVSEVAMATGLDVPAMWLYENPRLDDAVRTLAAAADRGLARIVPQEREGEHPLSFQQEGLLRVMDHICVGHRYQVAYAVELPDGIDEVRLVAAATRLAGRHPALTSRISGRGVLARQKTAGTAGLELERVRISHPNDVAAATSWWAAPTIELDGSLARLGLIGAQPRRVLALSAHQMVMDPWSWGLILRDLAVLYNNPDAESASALAYSDYARWQRQHLSAAAHEHHLGYWRRAADGYPPGGVPLSGPQGEAPPAGPAARFPLEVPAQDARALHAAGQAMSASLFEMLLALFHLAVGRWAGTRDVLVASATASRTRPGTEDVAGFFVNGRFTRSDLTGARTLGELTEHVRDRWRAGDAHRELHLEKVLFDLGVPDVANVKFSLNAIPTLTAPTLGGERLSPVPVAGAPSARRHVSVGLSPAAGGGLTGALTYRTDLLFPTQVRTLAEEFLTLCRSAATAPSSARIAR